MFHCNRLSAGSEQKSRAPRVMIAFVSSGTGLGLLLNSMVQVPTVMARRPHQKRGPRF